MFYESIKVQKTILGSRVVCFLNVRRWVALALDSAPCKHSLAFSSLCRDAATDSGLAGPMLHSSTDPTL